MLDGVGYHTKVQSIRDFAEPEGNGMIEGGIQVAIAQEPRHADGIIGQVRHAEPTYHHDPRHRPTTRNSLALPQVT